MRRAMWLAPLVFAACSATRQEQSSIHPVATTAGDSTRHTDAPFQGVWEACAGASSPDECSRYVLLQRGDRICGSWFYLATGDGYEGRVVARAVSTSEARREQICGRPGSEARTECADGWDRVDRPLRLCDGRLDDLARPSGACAGEYAPVAEARDVASLAREPWVQACLAQADREATR